MTASESEKRLQRVSAVHASWANTDDVAARMAPAWEARRWGRFLKMADPDGVLPLAERERKAAALRSAEYTDMARKRIKSQRQRREAQTG